MPRLRHLTLLLFLLAGAVAGSQVPRFVQEYAQRLGGALQEATRQLDGFRRVASQSGLAFPVYLNRLHSSPDASVVRTGQSIAALEGRVAELAAEAATLDRAPRLLKPALLAWRHDGELLAATWHRFAWTFTLDPAWALLGALAGILVNWLLWLIPRRRHAAEAGGG